MEQLSAVIEALEGSVNVEALGDGGSQEPQLVGLPLLDLNIAGATVKGKGKENVCADPVCA